MTNTAPNLLTSGLLPASSKEGGESKVYGGTGEKFNWKILKDVQIKKPFFLAGGISATDVGELQNLSKENVAKDLFAIDINSRFELAPGVKDIDLIKAFRKKLSEPYFPTLFPDEV